MTKGILNKLFYKYIFIITIILGVLLRFYRLEHYPFGFDQVQIAEHSLKISQGDFSLIGPRTGPANMFTGPLIYYSAAIFNLFLPSYWAVVYNTLFLSLITGLAIYFLAKKYLKTDLMLLTLSIWAFSPFLIRLDRIPWNPNLMMLAASLSFFPLLKKNLRIKDVFLVSLGVFLGYQAHFSGLLLLPLSILCFLIKKEKNIWFYLLIFGSFLLSILPTFIFDIRNNWLNTNGFIGLIINKDKVASYKILDRLFEKIFIVVETCGKLFFENNQTVLIVFTGAIVLSFFVYQNLKKYFIDKLSISNNFKIVLIWLITLIAVLSLYRESTPEYYYLVILPVLILVMASFLKSLNIKPIVFALLFFVFSFFNTVQTYKSDNTFSLGKQLRAIDFIEEVDSKQGISEIVYDLDDLDALGFKYLLTQEQIFYRSEGARIHLIYPYEEGFETKVVGENVALWIDERDQLNKKYYSTNDYIIYYNSNLLLLSNLKVSQYQEIKIYDLQSNSFIGKIEIYDEKKDSKIPNYQSNDRLLIDEKNNLTSLEDYTVVYYQKKDNFIFIFYTKDSYNLKQEVGVI